MRVQITNVQVQRTGVLKIEIVSILIDQNKKYDDK